jgi:rare lipoprotein A
MTNTLILAILSAFLYTSKGKATYYGEHWTGRLTASGERFHADSMTCAHKTLPFGTMLCVQDIKSGKEITVKVNDRLPKSSGVLIDLTYGAAREMNMIRKGVIQVTITEVGKGKIYKR